MKKKLLVVFLMLCNGSFLLALKGNDPYDLTRFKKAQDIVYAHVLNELRVGKKTSHWMWYIFPQVEGLASSHMSKLYAIKSVEEAQAYLMHPILAKRLKECTEIILGIKGRTAYDIFGSPDTMKLQSSMTLFEVVSDDPNSVYARLLDTYFQGKRDPKTLEILNNRKQWQGAAAKAKPIEEDQKNSDKKVADKVKSQPARFARLYKGIFLVSSLLVLYVGYNYWYP